MSCTNGFLKGFQKVSRTCQYNGKGVYSPVLAATPQRALSICGPYCSFRCSVPARTCNLPSYLPLIHTRSPLPLPSLGCRVQSAPAAETLTCPGSRATPLSHSSCRNQASSVGKSALSLSPAWYQYPLARGICVCPWAGEQPWWPINTCFWGPVQCLAALEGLSNRSW